MDEKKFNRKQKKKTREHFHEHILFTLHHTLHFHVNFFHFITFQQAENEKKSPDEVKKKTELSLLFFLYI